MKKSIETIAMRDAERNIGAELLRAVRDIKAGRGRHRVIAADKYDAFGAQDRPARRMTRRAGPR